MTPTRLHVTIPSAGQFTSATTSCLLTLLYRSCIDEALTDQGICPHCQTPLCPKDLRKNIGVGLLEMQTCTNTSQRADIVLACQRLAGLIELPLPSKEQDDGAVTEDEEDALTQELMSGVTMLQPEQKAQEPENTEMGKTDSHCLRLTGRHS